jgi:hypothetical protein
MLSFIADESRIPPFSYNLKKVVATPKLEHSFDVPRNQATLRDVFTHCATQCCASSPLRCFCPLAYPSSAVEEFLAAHPNVELHSRGDVQEEHRQRTEIGRHFKFVRLGSRNIRDLVLKTVSVP